RKALDQLNTTRQPQAAHKLVREIAQRVWGRGQRNDKNLARRLDAFNTCVGVIYASCTNSSNVEIPPLTRERADDAVHDIRRAIESLRQLLRRVHERTAQ